MTDPALGAALYFRSEDSRPIPVEWLDEALRLLALTGIPVHESSVVGIPGFDPDWTQPFPENEAAIRAGLTSNSAESIYLHGHPAIRTNLALRSSISAGLSRKSGYAFVVVPERVETTCAELLLATHQLTRLVAPCRYGIAYRRSARLAPSLYARGMLGGWGDDADKEELATSDRIFRFVGEVSRTRRHLRDGFRSIYPAQLLSDAHRQVRLNTGETVGELKLGVWTAVEDGLWLWVLRDTELIHAKELFEQSDLLLAG
jgi:hypothetical protein